MRSFLLPFLLAGAAGCPLALIDSDGPEGSDQVAVELTKSSYAWSEVQHGAGPHGTLTNRESQPIYLNAGDRYAPETQSQVYIAAGGDLDFEREEAGGWRAASTDLMMIEGTGLVQVPAGAAVTIRGGFGATKAAGKYRLKVTYYLDRDRSEGNRRVAYSASFRVD